MEDKRHQRILEHTGRRIRFYRNMCHMSQDQLAAAIHKSESTLSKYERGTIALDIVTLCDIAEALGIEPAQLLDYDTQPREVKSDTAALFGRQGKLYMYYYNNYHKNPKRMECAALELLHEKAQGEFTPCRTYFNVPPSGLLDECEFYYTGSMISHEVNSYISLQNHSIKSDRISIFIINPHARSGNAWGTMLGFASNTSALYCYKVLITPEPVPLSGLSAEDFLYTKEELMIIKQRNLLSIRNPVI